MKRTPGQRAFYRAMQLTGARRTWGDIQEATRREWEEIAKAVNEPDPQTPGERCYLAFFKGYEPETLSQEAYERLSPPTRVRWEEVGKLLDEARKEGYDEGYQKGADSTDPDW